jgi:hypothetical protein
MAKRWEVVLLKPPMVDEYPSDFFPRGFHLKRDAQELVAEVEVKGGSAEVRKVERRKLHPGRKEE